MIGMLRKQRNITVRIYVHDFVIIHIGTFIIIIIVVLYFGYLLCALHRRFSFRSRQKYISP